jgi:phosphoserine aminotransferase
MARRVYNFNPGPATLPLQALERVRESVVEFGGLGMSILEISHRSKQFGAVLAETKALLTELLGIPAGYHILFLGGGASLQFAQVPMNLLGPDRSADYIVTGAWSKKALKEARRFGKVNVAADTKGPDDVFRRVPKQAELKLDPTAAYVHLTSNNTIFSTQFHTFLDTGAVPIIADMSSDILSHRFDASKFGMIYAGAQKNLGPAGVTVVILSDALLKQCNPDVPTMLSYATHVAEDSLFNTPPVFSIFVVREVLRWVKDSGGLETMEKWNGEKGRLLYGIMDERPDFYRGTAEKDSRSLMNVAFRLPTEELEARFIAEGAEKGFVGMKGHRSVGGIRVSMYNALPVEGIAALVDFMKDFHQRNG